MSQPYIGEIRLFAGNFAPEGWNFCDGSTLAISEYTTLYQLIGTTYGGDGQTTFALPDLRGRVPIHHGQGAGLSNYTIGEEYGVETVALTTDEIPSHQHSYEPYASTGEETTNEPANAFPAAGGYYAPTPDGAAMNQGPITTGSTGGGEPHDNMAPFVAITYIISLFGIFPTQS